MTTLQENNIQPQVFSPKDVSPDTIIAAYLMKRMSDLPKESVADLMSLAPEVAQCSSPDEYREIAETIREILFPEILGEIIRNDVETQTTDALKKRSIDVGARIRKVRQELGMTQEQLAEKSGISQEYISRLENGEHSPSRKTIEKVAAAMNRQARDFDVCDD